MKTFVVKRFETNPFSADFKDGLVICDAKTGEPYCDIETGKNFVKEGDILEEGSFTVRECGKKVKHIVKGDRVLFEEGLYVGIVETIVEDEDDYYEEDLLLKDLRVADMYVNMAKESSLLARRIENLPKLPSTLKVKRKNVKAHHWLTANIPCPCCKQ